MPAKTSTVTKPHSLQLDGEPVYSSATTSAVAANTLRRHVLKHSAISHQYQTCDVDIDRIDALQQPVDKYWANKQFIRQKSSTYAAQHAASDVTALYPETIILTQPNRHPGRAQLSTNITRSLSTTAVAAARKYSQNTAENSTEHNLASAYWAALFNSASDSKQQRQQLVMLHAASSAYNNNSNMLAFDNKSYTHHDSVDSLSDIDGTTASSQTPKTMRLTSSSSPSHGVEKQLRVRSAAAGVLTTPAGRSNVNRLSDIPTTSTTNTLSSLLSEASFGSLPAVHNNSVFNGNGTGTLQSQISSTNSVISTGSNGYSSSATTTKYQQQTSSSPRPGSKSSGKQQKQQLEPLKFSAAVDLGGTLTSLSGESADDTPTKRRGFGVFAGDESNNDIPDTHSPLANKASSSTVVTSDLALPLSPESCGCADVRDGDETCEHKPSSPVIKSPVFTSQPSATPGLSRHPSDPASNHHRLSSPSAIHVKPSFNEIALFSAEDFNAQRHKESVAGLQLSFSPQPPAAATRRLRFLCARCCFCMRTGGCCTSDHDSNKKAVNDGENIN